MEKADDSGDFWFPKDKTDRKTTPLVPYLLDEPLLPGPDGVSSSTFDLPSGVLCPVGACTRYAFPEREGDGPTGSVRSLVSSETERHLPICSRTDVIPGAYYPDPTPLWQNHTTTQIKYRWSPLGCRLSDRNMAMLDGANGNEARAQCLKKKRTILFDGQPVAVLPLTVILTFLSVKATRTSG